MWNLIFYSYKKTIGYREIMRHYFSTIGLTPTVKSAWNLEKWENSQWIILDKKKHTNYFAELPFLAVYYYCFSFPIEYYPITKGKYRITKSLWDKDREIKLNAMFEIN